MAAIIAGKASMQVVEVQMMSYEDIFEGVEEVIKIDKLSIYA